MYVVSAGVKEVVTEAFYQLQKQKSINLSKNLEICMTEMKFNERGFVIGFAEPTIISTNKHLFVSHEKFPEILKGSNGIVIGDLVEDLNIVKSLELGTVISIGFCNNACASGDEILKKYLEKFDIVIVNDGNLGNVVGLLKVISGKRKDLDCKMVDKSLEKLFAEYSY